MTRIRDAAAAALALGLSAGAASAACEAGKPRAELGEADVQALYDCLAADMHAGYAAGPKMWVPEAFVADYRGWKPASAAPAAPGFHGERYLMTFVNDAGHEEYVRFAETRGPMPAGTRIAKESFDVSEDGTAVAGPLFLMEKAAAGTSPQSDDWLYMVVAANGAPQAVEVMSACHECHNGLYGERDGLGYPAEEVRVAR